MAFVGLCGEEGVGYDGVGAVDFAWEEGVGEAFGGFEAEGFAFCGGCGCHFELVFVKVDGEKKRWFVK